MHDLAKGPITQLLDQTVLVELVLVALLVQQILEALLLSLLGVEVEKASPIGRDVSLNWIEESNFPFSIVKFLLLRETQMTLL